MGGRTPELNGLFPWIADSSSPLWPAALLRCWQQYRPLPMLGESGEITH